MPDASLRLLKCSAAGQTYCVDVAQVTAIERGERLIPNPAGEGPCGWITRQGAHIPVFGLAERLGAGPRGQRAGAVLVMAARKPWGLAVDRIARFEGAAPAPQPVPAPAADPRSAHFRGVVDLGGSLVLYLEPGRLHPDAQPLDLAPEHPLERACPAGGAVSQPAEGRLLLFSPPQRKPGQAPVLVGVSYAQVLEIVSGVPHIQVPAAQRHVLGLIHWRRRAVAVLDAGALLGLEPAGAEALSGRLLVARAPARRTPVALPMGVEVQSRTLPMAHRACRQNLPFNSAYARGIFEISGDQVLIIPDLDAMAAGPRPDLERRRDL